jgi:hypothetical protein
MIGFMWVCFSPILFTVKVNPQIPKTKPQTRNQSSLFSAQAKFSVTSLEVISTRPLTTQPQFLKQPLQVNWLSLVFMILFLPGSIICICVT